MYVVAIQDPAAVLAADYEIVSVPPIGADARREFTNQNHVAQALVGDIRGGSWETRYLQDSWTVPAVPLERRVGPHRQESDKTGVATWWTFRRKPVAGR